MLNECACAAPQQDIDQTFPPVGLAYKNFVQRVASKHCSGSVTSHTVTTCDSSVNEDNCLLKWWNSNTQPRHGHASKQGRSVNKLNGRKK